MKVESRYDCIKERVYRTITSLVCHNQEDLQVIFSDQGEISSTYVRTSLLCIAEQYNYDTRSLRLGF